MENKIERLNGELVITLIANEEEWAKAQRKEFNKRAANLQAPGFRKGKVPETMARRMIDEATVMNDAMINLVNKEYGQIAEQEKVTPFSRPQLEVNKFSKTELECVVKVALPPEVKLGEYKNIEVALNEAVVTDEDVEQEVNKKLQENASLIIKEEPAELNDTVIIDFKGYVDGTPFEGGEAKAYELKLGSNSFIPGFEDQLVGIKAGESRSINVTFPENYIENLASKEAVFECVCHDVKTTVLPNLDDEFVEELNIEGVKTVEEYKAKVSADLLIQKQNAAKNERLEKIINTAIDNAEVVIADSIVEEEANALIENIKKQVESNGIKFDDYLKVINTTNEKLLEEKKVEAARNIKGMIVIEEICRVEKIAVDSQVLQAKYEELASMYNMKVEDVKKALEPNKNDLLRNLRNELFTKFILENNPLKEESKSVEE